MQPHPNPFPPVENRLMKLGCYSERFEAQAQVFFPKDVDELREVFKYARDNGCHVTIRGGAHSFDRQSLGDDLVISMEKFCGITVYPDVGPNVGEVRVGPAETWGDIVDALQSEHLMPAVTVTTEHATAGGTLAGDCLSRFSPAYGKEGTHIKSFEMMTVDGKLNVYKPPGKNVPPVNWTDNERVFSGVVGGLGYLGAVTAITYGALRVNGPKPIRIATTMTKHKSFEGLAEELIPATGEMHLQRSDPNNPDLLDSIFSALYSGNKTALLFKSRVVADRGRKRLLLHWPRFILRPPAEWLLRTRFGIWLLWRMFYGFVSQKKERYADDLSGYTFFMDGNVRAKRWGKALGRKMQTIQQTFIVPGDPSTEEGRAKAKHDLTEWLNATSEYLAQRKLTPTMFDVMWLPRDHLFPLSATADLPGFAVSYAFETSNKRKLARIKESFREFSKVLWNKYQGRVYLVKNVEADTNTLCAMYHPQAVEFFKLKQQLDPNCMLRNKFLDDTFGPLLKCPPVPTPTPQVSQPAAAQPTP